jgi:hypothetical protein
MKIVVKNRAGFWLSEKSAKWLIENKGWPDCTEEELNAFDENRSENEHDIRDFVDLVWMSQGAEKICFFADDEEQFIRPLRTHSSLVECIESNPDEKYLRIVEIPDDVDWIVQENDETGYEWIAERHRTWS